MLPLGSCRARISKSSKAVLSSVITMRRDSQCFFPCMYGLARRLFYLTFISSPQTAFVYPHSFLLSSVIRKSWNASIFSATASCNLLENHRKIHFSSFSSQSSSGTPEFSSLHSAQHETRKEEEKGEEECRDVSNDSTKKDTCHASSLPFRTLRLHNLPKNWLHEDIVQFLEQVASYAEIDPPPSPSLSTSMPTLTRNGFSDVDEGESDENRAPLTNSSRISEHVTSPFVHRLTIFFGRRTGIVFGSPRIVITSSVLCDVLLKGIPFEDDDYRARIYFTEENEGPLASSSSQNGVTASHSSSSALPACSSLQEIKETLEEEQQVALEQLELDRFLFAPDLLYDIARLHQRRLVTRSESVLLPSFRDADDYTDDADEEEENDGFKSEVNSDPDEGGNEGEDDFANDSLPSQRFGMVGNTNAKDKRRRRKWRRKSSLVRDQSDLGRGSMHNTPVPKPYVEGRRV